MKKYIIGFITLVFLFSVCVCASEPIIYDFGTENGNCSWVTSLSTQPISGSSWCGTTNAVNNTIERSFSTRIKGSDYPYFVIRTKYTVPEGGTKNPNTYLYFKTHDALTGGNITDNLYSATVSQNKFMEMSDNGRFVTYVYDFSGNTTYMNSYVSKCSIGVGNGYTGGVTVEIDFAGFVSDKNVSVSFADTENGELPQIDDVTLSIGSSFKLSDISAKKDGYMLVGFSYDEQHSSVFTEIESVMESVTLYPVWQKGYAWNFNTDGNFESVSFTAVNDKAVANGCLSGVSASGDPILSFPAVNLNLDIYNTVKVYMSAKLPYGTNSTVIQVFAGLDSKGMSEDRSLKKTVKSSEEFVEYVFNFRSIAENGNYSTFRVFRLDPVSVSGAEFKIDKVEIVPDVEVAAVFDSDGATGMVSRVLPDADGFVTLPEGTLIHPYKKFLAWTDGISTFKPGDKVRIDSIVIFNPVWDSGALEGLDTEYYPGYTKKAVIFSYDDGYAVGDKAVINILNAKGYKGTFNIISSHYDSYSESELNQRRSMYSGHEIANHSDTHPEMYLKTDGVYKYTEDYCINDISTGKSKLERIFENEIKGIAWPYTVPSSRTGVLNHTRSNYTYARGSSYNYSFDIPESFHNEWTFTVYQAKYDGVVTEYANKYKDYESDKLSCYSVWGHSSEFNSNKPSLDEFSAMLDICSSIEGGVWKPTNIEFVEYVNAMRALVYDYEYLYNPTDTVLYAMAKGEEITIAPGALYNGTEVLENKSVLEGGHINITANIDLRSVEGENAYVIIAAKNSYGRVFGCKILKRATRSVVSINDSFYVGKSVAGCSVYVLNSTSVLSPIKEMIYIPVE